LIVAVSGTIVDSSGAVRLLHLALIAPLVTVAVGCGSDDSADGSPTTSAAVESTVVPATSEPRPDTADTVAESVPATEVPRTTEAVAEIEPLQILVTNDDGVGAPGVDALVTALSALPDVELTIVAPAENQSGTSMNLTDGEVVASDAATASGVPATAVAGFPADSVRWALENLAIDFDLVVSGSNSGQNIGEFSTLSGTVGAARFGAQQGIAGIAVSQGLVPEGDIVFDDSVEAAIAWITEHRDEYESGTVDLVSINSPTCEGGVRGVAEVPLGAFDGRDALEFDCMSTLEAPVDDVDAFANGFTAITDLPIQV
jgi:5'-nucleotidase